MEIVRCPLCPAAGETRPYHRENGYQAVQCTGCGLVFVTPRPTETELKRLYEGQDTHIDLGAQIAARHRKRAEARAALGVLARHVRRGRLLEVGVGAGYFLLEAQGRGYRPVGVDINAHFVRFAREALGLEVVEGTLRAAPLPLGSFDAIFHRNVLSHLAHPVEELSRMAELLRPGGVMLFETGNVAELPAETWTGTDALALPDHLFHWSEATLRTLLDRTGFELIEVERRAVLGALPPLWRLRRAWSRRRPAAAPVGERPAFQPPRSAPPLSALPAMAATAQRWIADALARKAAAPNRRCSLVVVARRRAEAAQIDGADAVPAGA